MPASKAPVEEIQHSIYRGLLEGDRGINEEIPPDRCGRISVSSFDKQIGGQHYKLLGSYQPWKIIDALNLNFYEGTALAYLLRSKGNRVEDLEKAIHTLEHYVEVLKSRRANGNFAE